MQGLFSHTERWPIGATITNEAVPSRGHGATSHQRQSTCEPGNMRRMMETSETSERYRSRWRVFDDNSKHVDRFGILLLITSAAAITLSLVDLRSARDGSLDDIGMLVVVVFVGGTFLLALRASGVARRYRIIADITLGVGFVANLVLVIAEAVDDSTNQVLANGTPSVAWVVLAALAPVFVVRRLLQHRRASASTLFGAVSAYILIAISFDFLFLTLEGYQSTPFFGTVEPTSTYMYYSLVTITTLGYGDFASVTELGRLMSTIEAVIGQVYLVTFVAMIVGLLVAQRQRKGEIAVSPAAGPGEIEQEGP